MTSSWLFHEVSQWAGRNDVTVNRAVTGRLFQDYYLSAGVSESWLNRVRAMIEYSDYWQTGENLWADKSGTITDALDNFVSRGVEQQRF